MVPKQIVGLTGFGRSGKSEVINHLAQDHGFSEVSASGVIRDEIDGRDASRSLDRHEIRQKGLELKKRYGADFIIRRGIEQNQNKQRIVFDGVRSLAAARTLISSGGVLIGLVARPDVRLERSARATDGKTAVVTVEALLQEELPEMNSLDPFGMQILPVLWSIDPERIIDTSDMTQPVMFRRVDQLLGLSPQLP